MGGAQRTVVEHFMAIEAGARQKIARSRQHTAELLAQTRLDAVQALHTAAEQTATHLHHVRRLTTQQLSNARSDVPALLSEIRAEARQALQAARNQAKSGKDFVIDRATADVRYLKDSTARTFDDLTTQARKVVTDARTDTQASMREIAGQGPDKTLGRGFALVRKVLGQAITSADSAEIYITIQFRDGTRAAELNKDIEL